jgi:hypothetical protein
MKLLDKTTYNKGVSVCIFKFKYRSLLELSFENSTYTEAPSLLVQVGPHDLFYFSLGLIKYIFTIIVWGKHYEY